MFRFKRLVFSHIRLGQNGPTLRVPDYFPDMHPRRPVLIPVVIVVSVKIPSSILKYGASARPEISSVTGKNQRSTPIGKLSSGLVDISPGDIGRASLPGVVGACGALTAGVPGSEKMVIASVENHGGSLDSGASAISKGVKRHIGSQAFSRSRIDRDHFDSRPPGPERQPEIPALVRDKVGIDGVVVIGRAGLDDQPVVGPKIISRRRVKGGIGGDTDDGIVGAKGRGAVINPVEPVEIGEVRRPNVGDDGSQRRVHPGRHRWNHVAHDVPVHHVGGLTNLKHVVGT